MSHDITMGTAFVQLSKCNGVVPWKVVSPALKKLQWKDARDIGDREVVYTVVGGRYVARILYLGIYISGYIRYEQLYVVNMNGNRIRCSLSIEVLTCVNSSDYSWLGYEMEELIPSSAVVGGFGQDGTPLYVISVKLKSWKPGYYCDRTKQLYVKGFDFTRDNTRKAIKILVEN